MKAHVINRFGSVDVFETAEIAKPQVGDAQVLIEVRATSVNPLDYRLRRGEIPPFTHTFPAVLHADVAGTIVEKGAGVKHLNIGDEVYACAGGVVGRQGALAEYMLADGDFVTRKPKTLSFVEAAALPLVSITAWEAIYDAIDLKPGSKILIFGATGGVGHIAVQLAKIKGAKVYAAVGNDEKAALALSLGADVCIKYKEESVAQAVAKHTGGLGFDFVFDTVGGETFEKSLEAAGLRGTVMTIAGLGSFNMVSAFSKALKVLYVNMSIPMATGIGAAQHGKILTAIAELVDEGKLKPVVDKTLFTFDDVAKAHAYAESGKATGKVCLFRK